MTINNLTSYRWSLLLSAILFLQSCSFLGLDNYFRDRSNDYRQAEEFSEIEIPDGMSAGRVGQLYPLPEGGEVVSYEIQSEFEVPRPRSVGMNESTNEVRIQRLNGESWILVTTPPGETWPRIRSYLSRAGIPTSRVDPSNGIIETGLFKLTESPENFQQFRIQLSQGVQLNSTEIDILQRSFPEADIPNPLPSWERESDTADYEDWFRGILAETLAADDAVGTASLLGQEIATSSKVDLVTPESGLPYIEMRMDYERAWASVGYALSRQGFSIAEQHSSEGIYISDYQQVSVDEPSWWRRVFRITKNNPVYNYRVSLDNTDGVIRVQVENLNGETMSQRENYLVLQRIRNNLT
jgi:outer membrane protein assembly factor BamC